MSDIKKAFYKHVEMAFHILFDTFLIILMLVCFKIIDYVLHYFGFQNDIISSVLHNIIHPVTILVFFMIFVVNVLKEYLPKGAAEPRFEVVQINEDED
jgi:hypothetical protein